MHSVHCCLRVVLPLPHPVCAFRSQAQHTLTVHTYTGVDDAVGTACKAFLQLITVLIMPGLFWLQFFPSNMTRTLVGVRSASEKLVLMENIVGLFRVSVLKFLAFSI